MRHHAVRRVPPQTAGRLRSSLKLHDRVLEDFVRPGNRPDVVDGEIAATRHRVVDRYMERSITIRTRIRKKEHILCPDGRCILERQTMPLSAVNPVRFYARVLPQLLLPT